MVSLCVNVCLEHFGGSSQWDLIEEQLPVLGWKGEGVTLAYVVSAGEEASRRCWIEIGGKQASMIWS
jgi:hypothetical protein